MRSKKGFAVILLGLLAPTAIFAAVIKPGPMATLQRNETVAGDLYTASREVNIDGAVNGDLVAAGGNVSVSGPISQSVLAAGGNLYISGPVFDDIRVVGGSIQVSDQVGGDLVVAGGNVQVMPSASINGDVLVAAGSVKIDGKVGGSVKVLGGAVVLNNVITGSVDVKTTDLTVGPNAVINGRLVYTSKNAANISTSAQLNGGVEMRPAPQKTQRQSKTAAQVLGVAGVLWFLFKLAAAVLTVLILAKVFRKRATELVELGSRRFGYNVLTGFIVLVMVPVAILISALTLIGFIFAGLGLIWYILMLIMSYLLGGVLAGTWLWQKITKKSNEVHWKSISLGIAALMILGAIPVLGWMLKFFFLLWSLGTLATYWYERVLKSR
jgi:cytoskeletal protein CcmA (bactofilin family)